MNLWFAELPCKGHSAYPFGHEYVKLKDMLVNLSRIRAKPTDIDGVTFPTKFDKVFY